MNTQQSNLLFKNVPCPSVLILSINPNKTGWWWLSPPPLVFDLPFQNAKRLWFLLWWHFKLRGLTPNKKIILQVYYQTFWEISWEKHLISLNFEKVNANFEIISFFHNKTNLLFISYFEFGFVSAFYLCIICLYSPKMKEFELFILISRW